MRITNLDKIEIVEIFESINKYVFSRDIKWIKYVDLGIKVIRIISFSDEFLPLVEKQLTLVLKDYSDSYDDTIVLLNEQNYLPFLKEIVDNNQKISTRIKFEKIYKKANGVKDVSENALYDIQIIDRDFSNLKPIIDFQSTRGFFVVNDITNNIYYYNAPDLSPEEFIKEGHIFVQIFYNILKTKTSNLVHGAVIGCKNNGICLCARGQRGKSTLSVLSMLRGFDYVSDDYLILHKDNQNKLLSSPIYSIITLSEQMYNKLYDLMDGARFISNNARKDKYVFNISNFHDRFKNNYPIKLCIFPEIVSDDKPSICQCTNEEKGRAIVQLIQSTLMQTQDLSDHTTIKKLIDMVKDLPFYKLNLCFDIEENTRFLNDFMNNYDFNTDYNRDLNKICVDITFDVANILNSETGVIYSLNKFATNIYEKLINSIPNSDIINQLKKYIPQNPNIIEEFNHFAKVLEIKGLFEIKNDNQSVNINNDFAIEDNYRFSLVEYSTEKEIELIKLGEKYDELCVK